jgi:hypothetical protein
VVSVLWRFRDVVIASCVVGYNDTSTTYRIDIPTTKHVVSRDVKFDEDVRSSSSHVSPSRD